MQIFITGTSSGIGKYLGENLSENHEIIGVSRKNSSENNFKVLNGDLTNLKFLKEISENIPKQDYIILNAGVGLFGKLCQYNIGKITKTIQTNLISNIVLVQLLLQKEKIGKGIIFMGSVASKKSLKFGSVYSASKFGLRGFAMSLKNELKGISIQIINPKIVETNFHNGYNLNLENYEKTSLESILGTCENILLGKEKRFEIDL